MSAFNYSKWDNLEDSDDENEAQKAQEVRAQQIQQQQMFQQQQQLQQQQQQGASASMVPGGIENSDGVSKKILQTPKGTEKGRHAFKHNDRTIYEWEQSLDEVNIWIKPPLGVTANILDIDIKYKHLLVGIKGNPPFLNEDTAGEVIVQESFWSFDPKEGEITINLQKMKKGEMWLSALNGHGELDPMTKEEDKKRIMLERFAEENPGFDFSGAEFNGQIPDARKFMGGVSYNN